MTPLRSLLFFLFLFCASGRAEWTIAQRHDFGDLSGKIHASELLLNDAATEVEMQIIYFAPRDVRFQVALNLDGKIEGVRNAVDATAGIAGINGGYFESDLRPLGLLVSEGRTIHSVQRAKLLSGVFLVKQGRPEIIRIQALTSIKGIETAIQCGPFLVERGQPVPGLNADRIAARTFVFSCGPGCWGFGICRSATLAATGEIIAKAELIRDRHVIQALNLDGGSSTALYAKFDNREIYSEGRSIVSNYMIISIARAGKASGPTF